MKTITVCTNVVCLSVAGFLGAADAKGPDSVEIKAELKAPESFCHDPGTGDYFISNVNGTPTEIDNNGYITRLGPDLTVKDARFIAGGAKGLTLNAPKGMAILDNTLYVADIDSVRAYSLPDGKEKRSLRLAPLKVEFLNDIAVLGGMLYVTDTFAKKVCLVDPALKVSRIVCTMEDQPNGIAAVPGKQELLIATWGPGKLLRLDAKGALTTYFDGSTRGLKNLDGIVVDKAGTIYLSSFTQGKIYRLTPAMKLSEVASGLTTPADIGIDAKGRLLVPFMQVHRAAVMTLPGK